MKSPEFVPRSDEIKEEDERLYKNDPGMDAKKGRASKFVVTEEVVDGEFNVEDEMADTIDNNKDSDNTKDNKEEIFFSKTELLKQQIENDIKKEEKIGFMQNSPDAAHIGPEFYEEGKDTEEAENNENDSLYANIDDLEKQPTFISKLKYLIRKPIFGKPNNGKGKDNLKTLSDEKKERLSSGKIREVLHKSE